MADRRFTEFPQFAGVPAGTLETYIYDPSEAQEINRNKRIPIARMLQAAAAGVTVSASAPTNPASGALWWDTNGTPDNGLKVRVGNAWIEVDTDTDTVGSRVTTGTAAPSGGANGDLYIRTGNTQPGLYFRAGGNWTRVFQDTTGGGGASVTVSGSAPSNPSEGDLWWDTSATPDTLKIRIGNAFDGQWQSIPLAGLLPAVGTNGQVLTVVNGVWAAANAATGGDDGDDGNNGWSPVFGAEVDGERRIFRLTSWVGGEGTAPNIPTDNYLGSTGLVPRLPRRTSVALPVRTVRVRLASSRPSNRRTRTAS